MKKRVKISKKVLSILLCFAMLVSCVPVFSLKANAGGENAYNGTPVTPLVIQEDNYEQFGLTEDNWEKFNHCYGIRNAAELYGFAEIINSGKAGSAVLLQDIVVNTGTVTESGSSSGTTYSWTPIGTLDNPYTFMFDGNGHTISGLYVNSPDASYVGLFGVADGIATSIIENVTLTNSYLKGKENVGGIVGYAYGNNVNVYRCKVDATVGIYATGSPFPYVGGIIGSGTTFANNPDYITISDCVSFATVKGVASKSYIGGIVGDGGNSNTNIKRFDVSDCYYLAGSVLDKNGGTRPGMGYEAETSGFQEIGCTALSSVSDPHTCIDVICQEVKGTCAYTGCSEYTFCLICGKENGEKELYPMDANRHASAEFKYRNIGKNTHDAYCKACDAFMGTEEHHYNGPADCLNQMPCTGCGYLGYEPNNHFVTGYTYQQNETDPAKHNIYCATCEDLLGIEGHDFSTGNCKEYGLCEFCQAPNPADAAKHTGTAVKYRFNETDKEKHDVLYACCDAFRYSEEHTYADGVCQYCNYICTHAEMVSGNCTVCGQNSHKYVNRVWNETSKSVISSTAELGLEDYTTVVPTTTTWNSGWYLVKEEVVIADPIVVNGDVKLLLCDGGKLTASKGIVLEEGNSLTVYGQSADSGALIAAGYDTSSGIGGGSGGNGGALTIIGGTVTANGSTFASGIGGGRYGAGGSVAIYGGVVTVTGGEYGAGIGGGETGNGGTTTIYGGMITVTGGVYGAGIGAGMGDLSGTEHFDGGITTIHGGTVTATGGVYGAGIGGGNVTINGGTVIATGGEAAAGIGGGAVIGQSKGGDGGTLTINGGVVTSTGGRSGAGIGGGSDGNGGTVTIHGGTVTAIGGQYGAGIGGGSTGSGGTVTISGGTITATGDEYGAGIGGGMRGNGASVIISGGNVYATGGGIGAGWGASDHGTLTDSSGNAVSLVAMHLNAAANGTAVNAVTGIGSYGLNDVKTIEDALYFYLPSGADATKITAGGKEYTCNRNQTYHTEHSLGYQNITEDTHDTCCLGCGLSFEAGIPHNHDEDNICVCGHRKHTHNWEYTQNGNVIHAACKNENCSYENGDGGSMIITVPENPIYDGTAKEVIDTDTFVTGHSINMVYVPADNTDELVDGKPVYAGDYSAIFTVEGQADYTTPIAEIGFTIAKATYDMSNAKWNYTEPFRYDGKEHKVEITGLPYGVTATYTGNKAVATGDYTAKAEFTYDANNYNEPTVPILDWAIENEWNPTEYNVNGSGWMNEDFVIRAAEGYQVSDTNTADGIWSDSLTYSAETADGSVTFYLKNLANGLISKEAVVEYKLDKTVPTGKMEYVDRNSWEEFVNTITFGLFYKDEVTVKIESGDNLSGVAEVQYYASDKAMTLDEIKAVTDWISYNGSFVVTVEDAKQFVYFARITDHAGNVTYLSTNGATYDTTAPAISGIENGKTYYTTKQVTVTDKNLVSVTLNGENQTITEGATVKLEGNTDATYTIIATDKAGNSTAVTVTMKPVSAISEPIDGITEEDVTSAEEETVQSVIDQVTELLDDNALTDETRETLEEIKEKAEGLKEKIAEAAEATGTESIEKVKDITAENATTEDKPDLEKAKADLEKALEDYGDNYTDDEKEAIREELERISDVMEAIEKLTNDSNSPNTIDNSSRWLWLMLLFASGTAIVGITLNERKRKQITK